MKYPQPKLRLASLLPFTLAWAGCSNGVSPPGLTGSLIPPGNELTPAIREQVSPTQFAEQELRQAVSEAVSSDPAYQIDSSDLAALAGQEDLSAEELTAIQSLQ